MTIYALIGAAGYVAPRHLKAMRETGGSLAVAYDTTDSVEILDDYFPAAAFFTEFERFDIDVNARRRTAAPVDYVAVCSPSYLHKAHATFALRAGATAICEQPLVLAPKDIDDLAAIEAETGCKITTILQLRLHPVILALKERIVAAPADKTWDVDLSYFTSRGAWYHASWKGIEHKSGGIAASIGAHLYDMLCFIFGPNKMSIVHHRSAEAAAGYLEFRNARVRWALSINRDHLPPDISSSQTTYRSITVDGEKIEFSDGFAGLHTVSYKSVLNGNGYDLDTVRPSVELFSHIRHATIEPNKGEQHPHIAKIIRG